MSKCKQMYKGIIDKLFLKKSFEQQSITVHLFDCLNKEIFYFLFSWIFSFKGFIANKKCEQADCRQKKNQDFFLH